MRLDAALRDFPIGGTAMPPRSDADAHRQVVRGLIARWTREKAFTPRSDNWMRGYDVAFSRELSAVGYVGMTWPERIGGGGRSYVERLAVTEELLRAGAPVAAHWISDRQIGPAILRHGSEALQAEILPKIVTVDHRVCLGMSEPGAGSDLAAVSTRGRPVAGGWQLRGRKVWTSGAHHATHLYVLARTSDRPADAGRTARHSGLTEFIVDMDAPGVSWSPIADLSGEHHFNEVLLDDVFVPAHRVLGQVGAGWAQVMDQLSFERAGPERYLSSYPLLVTLLDDGLPAADLGCERELARLVARLGALRCMAFEVAAQMDSGGVDGVHAACLKYLGNRFEQDVVDFARRYLGSDALVGSALADTVLSSPGYSIRGGSADVMLSMIAAAEGRR